MGTRIGIYPGTFDPMTLGHMDIIERGAKLVDRLIIGVTTNMAKSPMFSDDERIAITSREVAGIDEHRGDRIQFAADGLRGGAGRVDDHPRHPRGRPTSNTSTS